MHKFNERQFQMLTYCQGNSNKELTSQTVGGLFKALLHVACITWQITDV